MPPCLPRRLAAPLLCALALSASGCDQLGIESASAVAARKEADGKAVGGACRHAGRAIEDCYTLNRRADRAAVYAGWREMSEYMRENKVEPVAPVLAPEPKVAAKAGKGDDAGDDGDAGPGTKAGEKPAAKGKAHAS